ncbi:unnamed protein product [Pieris macdunnoughi]|uniref:Uncharacterized protein n=1 Tax=Pieris macdunnoughi TaxID=345717 RepID=A0A821UHR0_9NEOP|nr:unnamed protein product [Pieris macdunnoughi]
MPVDKFEKIRGVIHFNDNDKHLPVTHLEHDKLHKLRPVIDHLNTKFSDVAIDQLCWGMHISAWWRWCRLPLSLIANFEGSGDASMLLSSKPEGLRVPALLEEQDIQQYHKNCYPVGDLLQTKQVMKNSVPRGAFHENLTSIDDVEITAVSWKDNKQVILASTYVGAEPVGEIER